MLSPRSHFKARAPGPSTGSGRAEPKTLTVLDELVEPLFEMASLASRQVLIQPDSACRLLKVPILRLRWR